MTAIVLNTEQWRTLMRNGIVDVVDNSERAVAVIVNGQGPRVPKEQRRVILYSGQLDELYDYGVRRVRATLRPDKVEVSVQAPADKG